MNLPEIALQRLHNQLISQPVSGKPGDIVSRLGAIQAQEYLEAKWAIGLRMTNSSADGIEQAFNAGIILRTHVLRPTWHFVMPADIRWLLQLTAHRVHTINNHYYQLNGLEPSILVHSETILEKALRDGNYRTRVELTAALKQADIQTSNMGYIYILMHAELEGLICSGPRKGKQFTYALLDERVPSFKSFSRQEALAELTKRYFCSRGPATLQDYRWWSGLTEVDVASGLEMVKSQFSFEVIGGKTYWFSSSGYPYNNEEKQVILLPKYDEYIVSYTDRSVITESPRVHHLDPRSNILFSNTVVIDGQVFGVWNRAFRKNTVIFSSNLLAPLEEYERESMVAAAQRYGNFLKLKLEQSLEDDGQ